MFSIYTSAFNLIKNKFDWNEALANFGNFAVGGEVVIAVNKSEDETFEVLEHYAKGNTFCEIRVVPCDISYQDPLLDGKVKDVALQATKFGLKLGVDMDERLPLWQYDLWYSVMNQFKFAKPDALMIHSLNLWGDYDHIQANMKDLVKFKWYLHKEGLHRGPVNFGRLPNGKVDISKSDTCELIYPNGELVKAQPVAANLTTPENFLDSLIKVPFVYHLGYANFQNRDVRNKNFWDNHWKVESGRDEKFTSTIEEMKVHETIPHQLPRWDEVHWEIKDTL